MSELLLIGLIALIVLGPQRLPELARSLGQGMKAFQDTLNATQPSDDEAAAQRGERMATGGAARGNDEGGVES